jgi:hypothetical protein
MTVKDPQHFCSISESIYIFHSICLLALCVSQLPITVKITLKKERFLVHSFRGFSPWSLGFITSGTVVKQNIMAGVYGRAKLLI